MQFSFVGKLAAVDLVDTVLLVNWSSFPPPTEESSQPDVAEQLIMSPETFMDSVQQLQRFVSDLETQGIIRKSEDENG